mgnify:CR=1 FL=1|tara:strand:+ start:5985 stop:6404 length:420 start_codon:yes stop_codon:yes gene_type:complete
MTATNGSRLTINEQVYFSQEEKPFLLSHRFNTRNVNGDEQPYSRRYKVATVWEPLKCGWVTDAAFLWIQNHGAGRLQKQPTEDEVNQRVNRIIELTFSEDPDILIHPGESIRISPATLEGIQLRSRDEVTPVTVTLIQR